jgi:DNA-binding HxlR family transcriptional regulator
MTSPKIGSRVRGSMSGRPIMVALDVLGRRGALRVLWELRGDPLTFRALQDACETNPGSLNTRLKELRELGIVDHDAGGYRLTEQGRTLMTALEPLQDWADRWAAATVVARR